MSKNPGAQGVGTVVGAGIERKSIVCVGTAANGREQDRSKEWGVGQQIRRGTTKINRNEKRNHKGNDPAGQGQTKNK